MREISLRATLPGGQVLPMLWIDDWDFNWQGQYHFARPVPLPGSASRWATTGTGTPNSGVVAVAPTRWR